MYQPIQLKNTTTVPVRNSINRPPLRHGLVLITLALACFALSPGVQAVVPAPDGGYPGFNTAEGDNSLLSLTTGVGNTAVGWFSLRSEMAGTFNTAIGAGTLLLNVGDPSTGNGTQNTAIGAAALLNNTTGLNNTAVGTTALLNNTEGFGNTAVGWRAHQANATGNINTALGDQALLSDPSGNANTAIGWSALASNTNCDDPGCTGGGGANTAVGAEALISNTAGGGNTAVGEGALINHLTGNQNIVLGLRAGQDLTNGQVNIYIANQGVPSENTTIRIGNVVAWTDVYGFGHPAHTATYIAGINGATASGGVAVYVNSDGQLGTLTSSARFKNEIKPMDDASKAILALKPVTFRYKHEIDPKNIPQFGLVAEDVEKVNPDLVVRDAGGKVYSVRYEAVNAMLLNEFLKEHRTVQEQKATIAGLKQNFAQQQKQIEALTAGLQKVSARLEVSKSAPQTALNHQ
jgi:hypothetical protein